MIFTHIIETECYSFSRLNILSLTLFSARFILAHCHHPLQNFIMSWSDAVHTTQEETSCWCTFVSCHQFMVQSAYETTDVITSQLCWKLYILQGLFHVQSPSNTAPLCVLSILTFHPWIPWNRNSLCNFKGNPLVKYHPCRCHPSTSVAIQMYC